MIIPKTAYALVIHEKYMYYFFIKTSYLERTIEFWEGRSGEKAISTHGL